MFFKMDSRGKIVFSLHVDDIFYASTSKIPLTFKCSDMSLSASVDASHDIHRDSKDHSLGGVSVFHRSTKQKNVSTEIVALFDSLPYILWFKDLLNCSRSDAIVESCGMLLGNARSD